MSTCYNDLVLEKEMAAGRCPFRCIRELSRELLSSTGLNGSFLPCSRQLSPLASAFMPSDDHITRYELLPQPLSDTD